MTAERALTNTVESNETSFGEENLCRATIGIRIFKVGPLDEESSAMLASNANAARKLAESLKLSLGPYAPEVAIITNGDLAEEGLRVLESTNLNVIKVDPSLAKRRAHLGKVLIEERSGATGNFSYTDMLNALSEEMSGDGGWDHYIFVSGDLAKRPEELTRQLIAMERVRKSFKEAAGGRACIIGSMVWGVHNYPTITAALEGGGDLSIENISQVFPNNAASMVEAGTHFSGIADNALVGEIEVDGKKVEVGGNEDFEYAFTRMVYKRENAVLVIEPSMTRLPGEEWKGTDSKYLRRQAVYKLYADRILAQAKARGAIPETTTFEDIIDNHLFFARLDKNGKPQVILTARQVERGINSPLEFN